MKRGWTHTRPYEGASKEWQTPPELLAALGPFDDDPAQQGRDDGLVRPWYGRVFLNPPYDRDIGKWMERMAHHNNGIALVFARVETRWFQEWVWKKATALLFPYRRLHFYRENERAKGNAGSPSVLVAYGSRNFYYLRDCKIPGAFVTAWEEGKA